MKIGANHWNVDWLDSEITNTGNYIWFANKSKSTVLRKKENHVMTKFNEEHDELSDAGLISVYNNEVVDGNLRNAEGFEKSLKHQFRKRFIDFSEIEENEHLSFRNCVALKRNKLYTFENLSKEDVDVLFKRYFEWHYPEKLRFNPTLVEFTKEKIRFGMRHHMACFSMSVNLMLKKIDSRLYD